MTENLYSSIQIVCTLKRVFPDLVVQKIRNYAKLAIDLNGYTLKELKTFVYEKYHYNIKIVIIHNYAKEKYKCPFNKLNRVQVIDVIQKINVEIPILRNRLDNYYKQCNKFNKYYTKIKKHLVLCDKQTNKETKISILEPIRFVYQDTKITIKILKWTNKSAKLLIIIKHAYDAYMIVNHLSHIEVFTIISKYFQRKSIPDEIMNLFNIIHNHSEIINAKDLDLSIVKMHNNEYTDLYIKDIVYTEFGFLKTKAQKMIKFLEIRTSNDLMSERLKMDPFGLTLIHRKLQYLFNLDEISSEEINKINLHHRILSNWYIKITNNLEKYGLPYHKEWLFTYLKK